MKRTENTNKLNSRDWLLSSHFTFMSHYSRCSANNWLQPMHITVSLELLIIQMPGDLSLHQEQYCCNEVVLLFHFDDFNLVSFRHKKINFPAYQDRWQVRHDYFGFTVTWCAVLAFCYVRSCTCTYSGQLVNMNSDCGSLHLFEDKKACMGWT